MKKILPEILTEETTEEKLFPNSFINVFSMLEYITILPVEKFPEYFLIWFSSFNKIDDRRLFVLITNNGKVLYEDNIPITDFFHFTKRFHFREGDNYTILIKVFNEFDEVVKKRMLHFGQNEFNNLHENGILKMHRYPKISVVTRIKNMSNQIERLHQSLKMQSFKDFEWIIFDNKSTDDIYSKIHEWRKKDNNIMYKRLPEFLNFWEYSYTETNGEIIVVVDADDFLTNNALETIDTFFNEHKETDMLIGNNLIFGHDNMKILDSSMFDNTAYHPTCYTRKCIEDTLRTHTIDTPLTDDHEIVECIRATGKTSYFIPNYLYFYRKFNKQSITWNSMNLNDYQKHPDWQKSSDILHNKINNLKLLPEYKETTTLEYYIIYSNEDEDYNDYNETTYFFQCMNRLYDDKINSLHIIDFKDIDLEILFRKIIKYIDKFCKDNSIIMFISGDYEQYATEIEILDKFYKNEYKKNQKILFSKDKYSTFIGESDSISYMLDEIIEKFYIDKNDSIEEQLKEYALNDDNSAIDTECEIFMYHDKNDTFNYKQESARIRNTITKTFPSILISKE